MNCLTTVITSAAAALLFSVAPAHALRFTQDIHPQENFTGVEDDAAQPALHTSGDLVAAASVVDEWAQGWYGIPANDHSVPAGAVLKTSAPVYALPPEADFNAAPQMRWPGAADTAGTNRTWTDAYNDILVAESRTLSSFTPPEVDDAHATMASFILSLASAFVCLRKKPGSTKTGNRLW